MGLLRNLSIVRFALLVGLILTSAESLAQVLGPQGLNLQGRLTRPDGAAVEGATVEFQLQLRSPGTESCILYEESHTLNMSNSDGVFSIRLGTGLRSGTNFKDTSSLAQALDNSVSAIGSLTCASGTSFDPSSLDSRKLRISFNEGSGLETLAQDQLIQAVPYAMYADRLQGKQLSDLVQVVSALEATPGTSQARVNRLIDTDWAGLDALLLGTSNLYAKGTPTVAVDNNNQRLINVADPTGAQDAATKNYADTKIGGNTATVGVLAAGDAGKALTWDGTKWVASAVSTADATKVAKAGDTMTGTLNLPANGLVAGTNQLVLSGGLVGIGTTTPLNTLDVYGALRSASFQYNANLTDSAATAINNGGGLSFTGRYSPSNFAVYSGIRGGKENATSGDYAGYLSFHTRVDGVASTTERMRITSAGNVGIGTSNPNEKLRVSGGDVRVDSTNAYIIDTKGGLYPATGAGISLGSTGFVSVGTGAGSPERMRIDTSGNVGIGTTSPGSKLHVAGPMRLDPATLPATPVAGDIAIDSAATNALKFYNGTSWISASGLTVGQVAGTAIGADAVPNCSSAQKLQMSLGPTFSWTCVTDDNVDTTKVAKAGDTMTGVLNLPANGLVAGTNQFVLSGGYVGIGTATPLTPLYVKQTSTAAGITLEDASTTGTSTIYYTSGADLKLTRANSSIELNSSSGLKFITGGSAERARIDSSGNFGVGTTAPLWPLHVSGSGNVKALIGETSEANGATAGLYFRSATSSSLYEKGAVIFEKTPGGNGLGSLHFAVNGAADGTNVTKADAKITIASAGGVGINTSTPLVNNVLDVNGAANVTSLNVAGAGTLQRGSGNLQINGTSGAFGIHFMSGSGAATPSMVLTNGTGRIGINTTTPALKFDVVGSAVFRGPTVGGVDGELFYDTATHTYQYYNAGTGTWQSLANGDVTYNGAAWGQNGANVYYDAGNVGIGTQTPGAPLDVKGTMRLSGLTSGYVGLRAADVAGNVTWTLPASDGVSTQVMRTNGFGTLSWWTPLTQVTGSGVVSVASTTTTPVVSLTNGTATGQATRWNGSAWQIAKLNYTDLVNTAGNSPWPATCAAGQALTYSTAADAFSCVTVTGGASSGIANGGNTLGANISIGTTDAFGLNLITNNTSRVSVTSAGNVGIGTAAPARELHVSGSASMTGVRITNTGTSGRSHSMVTTNTGSSVAAGALVLRDDTAGAERLLIDSTGKVGIGNTAPVVPLQITGTGIVAGPVGTGTTPSTGTILRLGTSGGGNNTVLDFGTLGSNGTWLQSTHQGALGTNFALLLNPNGGNVGVGTTGPAAALHVSGPKYDTDFPFNMFLDDSAAMATGVGGGILFRGYTSGALSGMAGVRAGKQNSTSGDSGAYLSLYTRLNGNTSVTERMRIDSTGNVGIGVNSPVYKLQVAGIIAPSGDGANDLGAASNRFKDIFASNGTVQTSDVRQKRDIRNSDLGLEFVTKLRPVSYRWKSGDENLHYGVIAQETERAIASIKQTSGRSDEVKNSIVTHDKKSDAYGVRYTELIAPVIKAVQELYKKILGHDRRIASLEAENAELQSRAEKAETETAAIKAYLCAQDPNAPICK